MKKYIFGFFTILGFLFFSLIALLVVAAVSNRAQTPKEPDKVLLAIDFNQPIVEHESFKPFNFALPQNELVLADITTALDRAAKDDRVLGLVAKFGDNLPSMAQSQEIRDALKRFRASGKATYAFATSFGEFGSGNRAYYLASAFEQIWLQPVGIIGLTGMRIEVPFAKSALEKIGVRANFIQREEYKNAMESLTRDDFSEASKSMMTGLMADITRQQAEGIAEGRGIKPEDAQWLINNGPYTAEAALQVKLIDKIGYADQLDKVLDEKFTADASFVSPSQYLAFAHAHKLDATKVALVHGSGMILQSVPEMERLGGDVMPAGEVAAALDSAADDADVKAIIFRIDSPGGSPVASETIRRAVVTAKEKGKLVVVSMGSVAGSGGYWIAMNADRIIAQPATLTGSIGVIGGKYVTEELWKKLGVNWGVLEQGGQGGMWSFLNDYTSEQLVKANMLMDDVYKTFVKEVGLARGIPAEQMASVAKGRVFTGAQAVQNKLVDELGGLDTAVQYVRTKLALANDASIVLEPFPTPLTPAERLLKVLEQLNQHAGMLGTSIHVLTRFEATLNKLGAPQGVVMPQTIEAF
jgi:protease IV